MEHNLIWIKGRHSHWPGDTLAVSFTFGIMASGAGLNTWQAVVMSFTNLTSAGQFAALGIIQAGAPFVEMAAAQLIINLRYCLMSCSLSQKLGRRHALLPPFLYVLLELQHEILSAFPYAGPAS